MKLKKLVALLLAALMAMSTLAGCGNSSNTDTTTTAQTETTKADAGTSATETTPAETEPDYSMYEVTEPTTIQFWHNGQMNYDFYCELADEFNKSQDMVTVEVVCPGSYDAIKEQLTAANVAGTGLPGLACMNFPAVPNYYLSGVFEELTPYLAANGVSTDDILDGLMEQVTIDGDISSMPWGPSAVTYYYNKTELAKHGLDKFPETWDELKVWVKDVTEATGKPAMTYGASDMNPLYGLLLNFGGDLLDPDDPTKTALDNESLVTRLKELGELIKAGYIVWSLEKSAINANAFIVGDTMVWTESCTNYDSYLESMAAIPAEQQFEIGMAWVFGDVSRYATVAGASLVMPANISQMEKNAAGKFLAFLMDPEVQARWAEFSGYILIHESNINNSAVVNQICDTLPEMVNIYPYLLTDYTLKPQTEFYDAATKEWKTAMQMIYIEGADFDSTYSAMIDAVEYILAGN